MNSPASITPLPLKRAPSLYFVNGWVDFFIMGGASVLIFLALRLWTDGARTDAVYTLAIWLSWICNWPHFSSTNHRFYGSVENIRQYPLTALLVPVLVVAGVSAALTSPATFAPAFVKIFLLWSPYHFCGQTLGISILYARRAGITFKTAERYALSCFIFGTYFTQTLLYESGRGFYAYYGIQVPILGIPNFYFQIANGIMWSALAIFAAFTIQRRFRKHSHLPLILFLPALSHYIWFVQGRSWASFQEFVPFFHSLQYLLIAWAFRMKERTLTAKNAQAPHFVARETARFGFINLLGGACLFYLLPLGIAKASTLPLVFVTGIILAGVQIHHFFVDGVIWKLKRNTVSASLMGDLKTFTQVPQERS